MTFLEKTKTECIQLLEKGHLRSSMNHLKDVLKNDSELRHDLTMLLSNYNTLLRNEFTLEDADVRRETNRMNKALLGLLHLLDKSDVSEGVFIETFLIICNEDKRDDMEVFFGKRYFPNADFINYGDPLPNGIYDVIVLEDEGNLINQVEKDNEGKPTKIPTEANKKRQKQMTNYLDATKGYFIYMGAYFPIVKYKDRVYFSNSRFSLYARLKELLDYMKYYGK